MWVPVLGSAWGMGCRPRRHLLCGQLLSHSLPVCRQPSVPPALCTMLVAWLILPTSSTGSPAPSCCRCSTLLLWPSAPPTCSVGNLDTFFVLCVAQALCPLSPTHHHTCTMGTAGPPTVLPQLRKEGRKQRGSPKNTAATTGAMAGQVRNGVWMGAPGPHARVTLGVLCRLGAASWTALVYGTLYRVLLVFGVFCLVVVCEALKRLAWVSDCLWTQRDWMWWPRRLIPVLRSCVLSTKLWYCSFIGCRQIGQS